MKVGLVAILLVIMISTSASVAKSAIPAWVYDLSSDDSLIYGIAKNYSTTALPPIHYAKRNAIQNWKIANGLTPTKITENLAKKESVRIAKTTLHFVDTYHSNSDVYALLSENAGYTETKKAKVVNCKIKQCSPKWLCEADDDNLSVLSVSAATGHPNKQLEYLLKNGQQLARMIDKAKVAGTIKTFQLSDKFSNVANIQERYKIKELQQEFSTVKLAQMCVYNDSIIGKVQLPVPSIAKAHNWVSEPNLGNQIGVVGHASGAVSTGRISDLIEVAARRGLFDIAKAKNIKIEGDLSLEVNSKGHFALINKSFQVTESVVSAFIADMKMELNDKYEPVIYIWLLENKG